MKLATIRYNDKVYAGVVRVEDFVPFQSISAEIPNDMLDFIKGYVDYKKIVDEGLGNASRLCAMKEVEYLSPIPKPPTFRDFMCFEEHFASSYKQSNTKVPEVYYEIPIFYFSNPNVFRGSGEIIPAQPHSENRDFEFEIGIIIGKEGSDISEADAGEYIFGFTILNDWSARDLQYHEMRGLLGPAKGKDYATSMGPVIVTKDELDAFLDKNDPKKAKYDLETKLTLNGKVIRENNTKVIEHSFAKMIERASMDVTLYPGEVLGSGTIGGGTIIEYHGDIPFLQKGDTIDMEVQGIGVLKNIVG
ncbi:fumarylacetoacetate hydrolase family protein [Paratissierella segnis]|jgi:fumarylacetoacetate (FAA) hydrolase|uniref:Fumarylacetoacetate hydrolase family protein n=1 Tax=Paratissierella segnis TaxID=2763679 RepID=A0A926ILD6_9FIRM|nr:fumarylacetoacetate hydrolase family protein [Paratissierella segnis]MBC8589260.1 fumarylacetoacetate hydrolase family protein [Paratissierella segnis]